MSILIESVFVLGVGLGSFLFVNMCIKTYCDALKVVFMTPEEFLCEKYFHKSAQFNICFGLFCFFFLFHLAEFYSRNSCSRIVLVWTLLMVNFHHSYAFSIGNIA